MESYFEPNETKPDKWFKAWSDALVPLGVSYQEGAAHIDLSPRTTIPMSSAVRSKNGKLFAEMIEQDARWFFELLPQCRAARSILVAGSVTNRYYMDEFIECIAYKYGFNRLLGPGVDLPVIFSSVSPSGGKRRVLLIQRIEEHKDNLLELMDERPASAKT